MMLPVVFASKLPEERRIRPPLKTRAGFRPEAWLPKPIAPHSQAGDHEFLESRVRRHTARRAPVLPTRLGERDTARRFVARRFGASLPRNPERAACFARRASWDGTHN